MLKHLAIRDYAIVDHLDLDVESGMTVITGETGAGKSIMLDALGLCIGDRADARTVRPGAQRADITATFDLTQLSEAQSWLIERDLNTDDNECLLRRTISAEGRSKSFINGAPATLADCAEIGALLVDIHSQHAHQSLLRAGTQRQLLDTFANADALANEVAAAARHARTLKQQLDRLTHQSEDDRARRDLLHYQVQELDALELKEGDIERLEAEQKQLANARFILENAGAVAEGCELQGEQLARLGALLDDRRLPGGVIDGARELIASSVIQLEEARTELQRYVDSVEIDPERLREVEQRLDSIYSLARKHRVDAEALSQHHQGLALQLEDLSGGEGDLEQLSQKVAESRQQYAILAQQLTQARTQGAQALERKVMDVLAELAMDRCVFSVALHPADSSEIDPQGAEHVEFLISTNPGAKPGPLVKIASGGELSRISLALQIAAADSTTAPTMIFDEVDVGIGGAVAEVVGSLLRRLAARVQVLCVTHLAQVAAMGNHQLRVSKVSADNSVTTAVTPLDADQRVEEIARMTGGVNLTDSSRAHARDLLASGAALSSKHAP